MKVRCENLDLHKFMREEDLSKVAVAEQEEQETQQKSELDIGFTMLSY